MLLMVTLLNAFRRTTCNFGRQGAKFYIYFEMIIMRPSVCEFRVNMLETALNVNHLKAMLSVPNLKNKQVILKDFCHIHY